MIFSLDLLTEALIFGVLLGCFYAAVSIGLSVSFGLLDVPHVAHPAVMILGSYLTYVLTTYGLDPLVAGVVLMPVFFGIAPGVSALAGAMLIVVGPVEPAMDRVYIGPTFCVVVLAGLGSMTGTLAAGLILGIAESVVLMFTGASWAPAVAFGLLLVVLGIRPQGLFGR